MKTSLLICLALFALPAHGFKLQVLGVGQSDIHERITQRAYDMAGVGMPAQAITGVRWNDNPPALRAGALYGGCTGAEIVDGVLCWTGMMRVDRIAIETLTMRENSIAPMRSHFGDMQFLHAMAGRAGESAAETRANVMRWAEFAWRVATGEIASRQKVAGLHSTGSDMAQWLGTLFRSASKKHWTVQDLFLAEPSSVRGVAFGSLLHLVEDSYSAAHVQRRTGRVQANGCPSYDAADPVVSFHTYVGQDAEKHGVCDNAPDWLESPRPGSPIDVLAEIVRAREDGRDWSFVRAILEDKVFRLVDASAAAAPGNCFEAASVGGEMMGAAPVARVTCD